MAEQASATPHPLTAWRIPHSLLVAAGYYAVGVGALWLLPFSTGVAVLWPASGIALAALLAWGWPVLPGVIAGCLLVGLSAGLDASSAAASAALTVAELAIAYALLTRVAHVDIALGRLRDVLAFVVLGALAGPALALLPQLVPDLLGRASIRPDHSLVPWVAALGESVGILIVAPALLTLRAQGSEPVVAGRHIELALLSLATLAVSMIVFGGLAAPLMISGSLPYAVFPVVFWAALRFGRREVALCLLVIAAIAVVATARNMGPFAGADTLRGLLSLYLFLGVLAVTGLLLAAVLHERADAEAAIRTSEGRYRMLVDRMNEGLVMQDKDGRITFVSDRFCEIIGYPREELIGKRGLDITLPTERERWHERHRLRQQGIAESYELTLVRKSGETMAAYISPRPFFDEQGRYAGSFALLMDISERRRAEEQARQHLQQLAHVSRVSSMSEMASAIAHEVNQPLTAITTYAYACLRMLRTGQAQHEDVLDTMERIATEAERAGEIIRHTRSFVRGDAGHTVAIAPDLLVTEVVRLASAEARQSGVELQTRLAEGLPSVRADPIQLQQVLLNLVRNAIEAITADDSAERRIAIATAPSVPGFVEIAVSDTGPGLAPADVDKAFAAFYTTKAEGIGIGLALSRSIVDAHGGRLWAEAHAGRGAIFRLTLPTADDSAQRTE